MSVGIKDVSQRSGRPVTLRAGQDTVWLPIGVTVAWALIAAAGAPATLADDTPIAYGEKYIEVGTVMVPITTAEVNTITIDATGGSFRVTVNSLGLTATTPALVWNIPAASLKAALEALSSVGYGRVTSVVLAGSVYTITFSPMNGNVTVTTDPAGLTGGAGTAAVATTTAGTDNGGLWAPFDSSQSDGRQTLARDRVGLINTTVKYSEATIIGGNNLQNDLLGLLAGGLVFGERLKVGGTNQPSLAALQTAMPMLRLTPKE